MERTAIANTAVRDRKVNPQAVFLATDEFSAFQRDEPSTEGSADADDQ